MKQVIFYEIINKLKSKPSFVRKFKIFAVLGLVGVVAAVSLALWAGASALSYAVKSVDQVAVPLKTEIQQMQFRPLNCWGKAQSLLTVQPWIEKPALDNLRNLKMACLESKPTVCEGVSCDQVKKLMNTAEGSKL